MKPITPDEVINLKENILPDEVIEAFNICIAKNWTGGISLVKQNEVIEIIQELFQNKGITISVDEILKKRFLDVEPIYQSYGWSVFYDKPGYDENYEPSWSFKKKFSSSQ
jgi:hypothetical protein